MGGGQTCIVIKTDGSGNELWRQRIMKSNPNVQAGNSIVQDSLTKKIIVVGYQYIGSQTQSNVLILDSLGNKIHQTTFNNESPLSEIIQLNDKNFLACGALNMHDNLGIYHRWKGLIVKFDINGNEIWSKTYNTTSPYNGITTLLKLPDGNVILGGNLDTLLNHNIPSITRVKLTKINQNGELIWDRYIGSPLSPTTSVFIRSINPTQDKGFIISTAMQYLENGSPYSIIKIDSMGCDTAEGYCKYMDWVGIDEFNSVRDYTFEYFPNPASEKITLQIEAPPDRIFAVNIQDIQGRMIRHEELAGGQSREINTSSFSPGLYFVQFFHQGRIAGIKKLVIAR